MTVPPETDQLLVRYLLDQASEDERTQIERRFLEDEGFYQQLLMVEEELRVAYAAGTLPAADRQRFEDRFLLFADDKAKVEDTRALMAELAAVPRPIAASAPRRWSQWALAAAVILAAGLAAWQAFESRRLELQVAALEAERQARTEERDRALESERRARAELEQRPVAPAQPVLSLLLTPGRLRDGGETKRLRLSATDPGFTLTLTLAGQRTYDAYQVEIRNADGTRVWGLARAEGRDGTVMLTVPARLFPQDDYEVVLRGVTAGGTERSGEYFFTILR